MKSFEEYKQDLQVLFNNLKSEIEIMNKQSFVDCKKFKFNLQTEISNFQKEIFDSIDIKDSEFSKKIEKISSEFVKSLELSAQTEMNKYIYSLENNKLADNKKEEFSKQITAVVEDSLKKINDEIDIFGASSSKIVEKNKKELIEKINQEYTKLENQFTTNCRQLNNMYEDGLAQIQNKTNSSLYEIEAAEVTSVQNILNLKNTSIKSIKETINNIENTINKYIAEGRSQIDGIKNDSINEIKSLENSIKNIISCELADAKEDINKHKEKLIEDLKNKTMLYEQQLIKKTQNLIGEIEKHKKGLRVELEKIKQIVALQFTKEINQILNVLESKGNETLEIIMQNTNNLVDQVKIDTQKEINDFLSKLNPIIEIKLKKADQIYQSLNDQLLRLGKKLHDDLNSYLQNTLKVEFKKFSDDLKTETIKHLGESDSAMYDSKTPSVRKSAVDSILAKRQAAMNELNQKHTKANQDIDAGIKKINEDRTSSISQIDNLRSKSVSELTTNFNNSTKAINSNREDSMSKINVNRENSLKNIKEMKELSLGEIDQKHKIVSSDIVAGIKNIKDQTELKKNESINAVKKQEEASIAKVNDTKNIGVKALDGKKVDSLKELENKRSASMNEINKNRQDSINAINSNKESSMKLIDENRNKSVSTINSTKDAKMKEFSDNMTSFVKNLEETERTKIVELEKNKCVRIDLTGQLQKIDYRKSVIALCEVSETKSTNLNSYSNGTISIHRNNGIVGSSIITAQIAIENQYNKANYVNATLLVTNSDGVKLCTFKYKGKTYGGLELYLPDSNFETIEFYGVTNFKIFGLDYDKTDKANDNFQPIEEIKSSISFKNIDYFNKFSINGNSILHEGNYNANKPLTIESNVGNHIVLKRSGELKGALTANQDGVALYNEKSKKMLEVKDTGEALFDGKKLFTFDDFKQTQGARKDNLCSCSITEVKKDYFLIKSSVPYGSQIMPSIVIDGRGITSSNFTDSTSIRIGSYYFNDGIYMPKCLIMTNSNLKPNSFPIFVCKYEDKIAYVFKTSYFSSFTVSCFDIDVEVCGVPNEEWIAKTITTEEFDKIAIKKQCAESIVVTNTSDLFKNKLDTSGGAINGNLTFNEKALLITAHNCGILGTDSNGKNRYIARIDTQNRIHIGSSNENPIVLDSNNVTVSNNKIWHTGNFDPNSKLSVSGGRINGVLEFNTNAQNLLKFLRDNVQKGEIFTHDDGINFWNAISKKRLKLFDNGSAILEANNLNTATKEVVGAINELNTISLKKTSFGGDPEEFVNLIKNKFSGTIYTGNIKYKGIPFKCNYGNLLLSFSGDVFQAFISASAWKNDLYYLSMSQQKFLENPVDAENQWVTIINSSGGEINGSLTLKGTPNLLNLKTNGNAAMRIYDDSGNYEAMYGMDQKSAIVWNGLSNTQLRLNSDGTTTLDACNLKTNTKEVIGAINELNENKMPRRQYIENIDFNNLKFDKLVYGYKGFKNAAYDGISVADIKVYSTDWIVQKQYAPVSDGSYKEFTRTRYNGKAWSKWHEMWHSNNFDPNSKLNIAGGELKGPLTIDSKETQLYLKSQGKTKGKLMASDNYIALENFNGKNALKFSDDGNVSIIANNLTSQKKELISSVNSKIGEMKPLKEIKTAEELRRLPPGIYKIAPGDIFEIGNGWWTVIKYYDEWHGDQFVKVYNSTGGNSYYIGGFNSSKWQGWQTSYIGNTQSLATKEKSVVGSINELNAKLSNVVSKGKIRSIEELKSFLRARKCGNFSLYQPDIDNFFPIDKKTIDGNLQIVNGGTDSALLILTPRYDSNTIYVTNTTFGDDQLKSLKWSQLWHSDNFNPNSKLNVSGGTMTGDLVLNDSPIRIKHLTTDSRAVGLCGIDKSGNRLYDIGGLMSKDKFQYLYLGTGEGSYSNANKKGMFFKPNGEVELYAKNLNTTSKEVIDAVNELNNNSFKCHGIASNNIQNDLHLKNGMHTVKNEELIEGQGNFYNILSYSEYNGGPAMSQIAFPFIYNGTQNEMFFRTAKDSVWRGKWNKVWHDGNFNPDSKINKVTRGSIEGMEKGTSGIYVGGDNEINFSSNANYMYFNYRTSGNGAAIKKFIFCGADGGGKTKADIICQVLQADNVKIGESNVWHSGNLNPNNKWDKTTLNGKVGIKNGPVGIYVGGDNGVGFSTNSSKTIYFGYATHGEYPVETYQFCSGKSNGAGANLKAGNIYSNDHLVWHSGNFNPDSKFNVSGGTINGKTIVKADVGLHVPISKQPGFMIADENGNTKGGYYIETDSSLIVKNYVSGKVISLQPNGNAVFQASNLKTNAKEVIEAINENKNNISSGVYGQQIGTIYTGDGGKQPPKYLENGKVKFLMTNEIVNGNGSYKDWIYMDTYTGSDVPITTAFGIAKETSLRAFLMNGPKGGNSWDRKAEFWTTANFNPGNYQPKGSYAAASHSHGEYQPKGSYAAANHSHSNYQPKGSYAAASHSHDYLSAGGGTLRGGLTVQGNINASGDITAFSDRRLKSNIQKIENALEKVNKLNGYTFDINNKRSTGVIAQELQKVLPEAVGENSGYLTVAYGNIIGLAIEAIKELSKENENMKKENEKLKETIKSFEDRFSKLEELIK